MANLIAIAGKSGIGKTTSARTLDPKETFIISIVGKPLPFAGAKKKYTKFGKNKDNQLVGNLYIGNKPEAIQKIFNIINKSMPHIKNIVIDDANYIQSAEVMERAEEKGYDKHTQISKHYYEFIMSAANLRDDLNVIFLSHIENVGDVMNPDYKLKTCGK